MFNDFKSPWSKWPKTNNSQSLYDNYLLNFWTAIVCSILFILEYLSSFFNVAIKIKKLFFQSIHFQWMSDICCKRFHHVYVCVCVLVCMRVTQPISALFDEIVFTTKDQRHYMGVCVAVFECPIELLNRFTMWHHHYWKPKGIDGHLIFFQYCPFLVCHRPDSGWLTTAIVSSTTECYFPFFLLFCELC